MSYMIRLWTEGVPHERRIQARWVRADQLQDVQVQRVPEPEDSPFHATPWWVVARIDGERKYNHTVVSMWPDREAAMEDAERIVSMACRQGEPA